MDVVRCEVTEISGADIGFGEVLDTLHQANNADRALRIACVIGRAISIWLSFVCDEDVVSIGSKGQHIR